MRKRLIEGASLLLEFYLSGFLVGALTGVLDAGLSNLLYREVISFPIIINAVITYSGLWSLIGLVIFVIFLLWSIIFRRPLESIRRRNSPLLLFTCLSLFLIGFVVANKVYLPVAHTPKSLVFDLAWFIFWILVYFFAPLIPRAVFKKRPPPVLKPTLPGFPRLLFLGLICLVILSFILIGKEKISLPESTPDGPNIVLLVIDNVRADHLHCYGYDRQISPNIDALSREGILFSTTYDTATSTLPAMVSLLTSLYPTEHGTNNPQVKLSKTVPTLLGELKKRGYRIGVFTNSTWIAPAYGIGIEADFFDRPHLSIHHVFYSLLTYFPLRIGDGWRRDFLFSDMDLTNRFLKWGRNIVEKKGKFFAYLHLLGPHVPYSSPAEYREKLGLGKIPMFNPPSYRSFTSFQKQPALKSEELRELIGNYDASIMYSEQVVGRIVDDLKRSGIYNDTLFIFTSDHGEEFYEHGGWFHGGSLYEEQSRVPMIMSWPGHLPQGERSQEMVKHIDIMPMILYLSGPKAPRKIMMQDLIGAAQEKRRCGQNVIYNEIILEDRGARAIREGRYKLIYGYNDNGKEAILLFDLEDDPKELMDIYNEKPKIAARLMDKLKQVHNLLLSKQRKIEETKLDNLTIHKLKTLGYLQ